MSGKASAVMAPRRDQPKVEHSVEIERLQLLRHLPTLAHVYVAPFLLAYPLAIYIYTARYDDLLGDQAYTFLLCLALFGSHGLSWLGTKWSTGYRASTTCVRVRAPMRVSKALHNDSRGHCASSSGVMRSR